MGGRPRLVRAALAEPVEAGLVMDDGRWNENHCNTGGVEENDFSAMCHGIALSLRFIKVWPDACAQGLSTAD